MLGRSSQGPFQICMSRQAAHHGRDSLPLSRPSADYTRRTQAAWDPVQEEELQAAFRAFTLFGHGAGGKPAAVEMDGRSFAKLARDCGLLGAHLTPAQVDITFSKVKAKARAPQSVWNSMS